MINLQRFKVEDLEMSTFHHFLGNIAEMKLKQFLSIFIVIACILLYSCSSTKFVPEDKYWLQSASIKSDTKKISPLDMEVYLAQKPNYKTLAIFRLPLFIYNLSGKDSTKWVNKVLRSGGEPPVVFDSTMVDKTVDNFTRVLNNQGYVHASVTPEVKWGNKKVKVQYNINAGEPYKISDYGINIPDSVFSQDRPFGFLRRSNRTVLDSTVFDVNKALLRNTLVKSSSVFDLNMLDEERSRVSSIFRRFGYYDFNKEYIGFVADTAVSKDRVDLELTVYPFMQKAESGTILEIPHKQYIVREIDFYVDYNPVEDGDLQDYAATDTVYRENGNYRIYYGKRGNYIRPHIILNNCYIMPGTLYSESSTSQTYNSLSQLHILRNVNIRYEKIPENDSTKLKCIITCVPDKKQGISTEIEGTNSGKGRLGVGASMGYLHRNIFQGSELFNVKIHGGYEAISTDFSNFSKNYFEVGGEMSITFPRFMFPFLKRDLRRRLHASTQLTANYIFQRRPEYFTRTILSSGIKYMWNNRRNNGIKHSFDLVDISYVRIPDLSDDFSNKLTNAAKVYSFTDQFILSTGYTYSNTNFNPIRTNKMQSIYSIRAQVETAGNLLSLIANITDAPKDELGSRKIFGTRFAQYARANFDYSRTIPIDEKNAIAWRIGGGIAFPYGNNKEVPIQKRFFSGGANSVRGWGIRELGPGSFYNDSISNFYNQSGDIRFDANVEYRSRFFWKFELAAFLDAGNIWTVKKYENQENGDFKLHSFYKEIAVSWGLGLRLDLDFVLIRLDCGWKAYDPAKYPSEKNKTKWPITEPFKFRDNTAWHIAVGYPF